MNDNTLTHEDLQKLARPFPVNAHTFNKRGFCYVKETEVTERLEEIDPAWQFDILEVKRTGIGDQLAVVTARMTVKGVSRSSTGMQAVEYTNQKDAGGKVTGKSETEAGEAEKGATTDALRRCARLFGVGRYILSMGDAVKNEQQLANWLKQHYQANNPRPASNGNQQQANGNSQHNNVDSQRNGNTNPEQKIAGVTSLTLVEKNGKKWIEAAGVRFWSREPWRKAGYEVESWDTPGTTYHMNDFPFTVVYRLEDNFKNGVRVEAE